MIRFRFKKGLVFLQKNTAWTLLRRQVNGKLEFRSDTDETASLADHEVYRNLEAHDWAIDERSVGVFGQEIHFASPKDIRALSEKAQAEVKRKMAYISGAQIVHEDGSTSVNSSPGKMSEHIAAVAAEIADAHPPSTVTVWRWWHRFRATRCIMKMADRRRGGVSRKTQEQLDLLEEAVSEVYLSAQRKPVTEVIEAVSKKIDMANKTRPADEQIAKPSRATIYRWMERLYYEVVATARAGKKVTQRELRMSGNGLKVKRVLERIELDHTPLDLNLICSETKMVLGRPWLTLAIDRKSRMIVGFYVSYHEPSASSVLYCLRMAIKPKDEILAKYQDLRNDWPAYGLFETLALDNGMEEHASALEAVCVELGIELLYCEPGMPMQKGVIERLFRTLAVKLIHQLPGTVFSNPEQRGAYPSETLAALDIEDFTHILVKWIVDVYHMTPHRSLSGKTPLQVWQEEAPRRNVDLPAYPAQLDTMVGLESMRFAQHYGIEYGNLLYNSRAIAEIRAREGKTPKVRIRVYDHDVGYIDVYDEQAEEFIRVQACDIDYADGLSRVAHLRITAEARQRFGADVSAEQRREVKREIEEIVAAAVQSKKTRVRKRAAAHRGVDSERVLDPRGIDALSVAMSPVAANRPTEMPLHAVSPTARRRTYAATDLAL